MIGYVVRIILMKDISLAPAPQVLFIVFLDKAKGKAQEIFYQIFNFQECWLDKCTNHLKVCHQSVLLN